MSDFNREGDIRFSILMSLYYKEKASYLNACFESLVAQNRRENEIILVIDGPIGKDLEQVISQWYGKFPSFKLVRLKMNVGLGKALNEGIKHCSYNLVARMDTDDICHPDRFLKQIECFSKNMDISICGSAIKEIDAETQSFISVRNVPLNDIDIRKQLPIRSPFNHMTVMYKKNEILKCGGYKHLPLMEDWYLWCRLLSNGGKAINLPDNLVIARTGFAMIERRSGFNYVKSEWCMHKVRTSLNLTSSFKSTLIFIARAFTRLLPKYALKQIYFILRRN